MRLTITLPENMFSRTICYILALANIEKQVFFLRECAITLDWTLIFRIDVATTLRKVIKNNKLKRKRFCDTKRVDEDKIRPYESFI